MNTKATGGELRERLLAEAGRREAVPSRVPTMNPAMRFAHPERLRDLLSEAAAALNDAAPQEGEAAQPVGDDLVEWLEQSARLCVIVPDEVADALDLEHDGYVTAIPGVSGDVYDRLLQAAERIRNPIDNKAVERACEAFVLHPLGKGPVSHTAMRAALLAAQEAAK